MLGSKFSRKSLNRAWENHEKRQEILSEHHPFCLLLYTLAALHFTGVAFPAGFKSRGRLHCRVIIARFAFVNHAIAVFIRQSRARTF